MKTIQQVMVSIERSAAAVRVNRIVWVGTACLFLAALAWADSAGQAQIDFANGLFQRGFNEEAVAEYAKYLEKFPDGEHVKTAYHRMGEAAHAAGELDKALEAFDKLLGMDIDPQTRQEVTLSKGEVLYGLNRTADAVLVLEPLIAEGVAPDIRARALYYLGKVNLNAQNADAAIKHFATLVEQAPDDPLVPYTRYQLAFAYVAKGELENAAVEFSAVASSQASAELRVEARFRAAETYDKLGWFAQAVGAYEQLKKEFPDSDYARRADYGYAWALYHAGKYAEAIKAADAFLGAHADSPLAMGVKYLRANCLQQQTHYEEAIAIYNAIREENPESEFATRCQYKIAWCLYLGGKLAEAKEHVMAFLQSSSETALVGDAAFLLGTIMVAQGDYENAYEEFRLVAEKYPKSEFGAEALYKGAECLAQLGRTDEAAEVFEEFAKKYPDNPLAEDAVMRSGDAELSAASFEQAVAKYKSILESATEPSVQENALYRLAITYHNMKNYAESAKAFQSILERFPKSQRVAEAHFRVGEFHLRESKDAVKAIEAYDACLTAEPKGKYAGRALKGMALARYESKDLDAASDLFLRLMTEFPAVTLNEDTYAWVGQRLFDQNKWDQAAKAFKALLEANPDYPNPERVRFKIAECSEAAGNADEAAGLFQAVIEAAPQSAVAADAKFRVARIYEAQGKMDEAVALFEEAANANTGETATKARFHLGELYEAQGDFETAARSFMWVAVLFMDETLSPEALWRAGTCFEKAESPGQAKKLYEELTAEYPESEYAAKAKEALAKMGTP